MSEKSGRIDTPGIMFYAMRERHAASKAKINVGYPCTAIVQITFLYLEGILKPNVLLHGDLLLGNHRRHTYGYGEGPPSKFWLGYRNHPHILLF